MTTRNAESDTKGSARSHVTRLRVEKVATFMQALKHLLEQGAEIHSVTIRAAAAVGKAKARTISGRRKDAAASSDVQTVKKKPKKRGRPRVHRQKANESDADYRRRLDRARQQRARARKKKERTR